MVCGDIRKHDWSDGDVVLITNTVFEEQLCKECELQCERLAKGAVVVSLRPFQYSRSVRLVQAIEAGYDLIVVNYANPDMVGHTGDLEAAIAACEAVDAGLGRVLKALEKAGGAMIVTADHGNCEMMIDPETGGAHTAHTLNPVPVVAVGAPEGTALRDGRLADLAPTVLELMGLPQPEEMTGKSLLS
mgnify:CR=1 FL=1